MKRVSRWKTLSGGKTQIFAQSSIMRIPHYNTSRTEPPYWLEHGEQIFEWSVLKHKQDLKGGLVDADIGPLEAQIPKQALDDFLARRARNFQINQALIELAVLKEIDYLVFSQDDTSEYGLNVLEKSGLVAQAEASGAGNVIAYAGTDETILVLMSRWLVGTFTKAPQVSINFSPHGGASVRSKFEGQMIGKSVSAVAYLVGLDANLAEPSNDDDMSVIIHAPADWQGDHLGSQSTKRLDTSAAVRKTIKLLEESPSAVVLCDLVYANGADPLLIDALLEKPQRLKKLCGFAGWNTTNNTVGSALAMGIAAWHARLNKIDWREDLKRLLFMRLADDWAYQALVRREMNDQASDALLQKLMTPFLDQLANALEIDPHPVKLRLPWRRTFEVEVDLQQSLKTANIGLER
jgi:hypothetical protein